MLIADAHVHFWDIESNYLPWLCDKAPRPFRYGDYGLLRRNYLPQDYLRDSEGFEVKRTVYVETEWDPGDPVGETRWVQALRRRYGMPTAMVAQAWLDADDAPWVLEQQASFHFVRGIRHKPRHPDAMLSSAWRSGFARLAPLNLSYDLQAPHSFFAAGARLAADFPDTTIVVNHAGLPSDRSSSGLDTWRRNLARLAECPNVYVKISGLGLPGRPWRSADNRPIVMSVVEAFGIERCMFASNFPVDGLVASFREIYTGFRRICGELSQAELEQLSFHNAVRIYRL